MSTTPPGADPSFAEAITGPDGRVPEPNLLGHRDVERSWIAANLSDGPGATLDFGAGTSWMALLAARRGWSVSGVDLMPVKHRYVHHNLRFEVGDIMHLPLREGSFGLIISCSAIEHVGLAGRYSVNEDNPDGDLHAMRRLTRLLKEMAG